MKSYLLAGIDPELYKDFKAACAHNGKTMRSSFIEHMHTVVDVFAIMKWSEKEKKLKPKNGGKKR